MANLNEEKPCTSENRAKNSDRDIFLILSALAKQLFEFCMKNSGHALMMRRRSTIQVGLFEPNGC